MDFPGKNTGTGCHFLLQEIFPTQGSNPKSSTLQAASLPSELPGKLTNQKEEGIDDAVNDVGETGQKSEEDRFGSTL